MLPYRLVYHERYDLHLGDHVFPVEEIPLAAATACCATGSPSPEDFVEPEPATDDDVRLVHDAE